MDRAFVLANISRIDLKINEYRHRAQACQRLIELQKHNINTFTFDPYEPECTIETYQNELEGYKMLFQEYCEELYHLKQQRNGLQRMQNNLHKIT